MQCHSSRITCSESEFKKQWLSTTSRKDNITKLANYFICSKDVIARRALDKKFIFTSEYKALIAEYAKEYKRAKPKTGYPSFYTVLMNKWDRNLLLTMNSSVKSGDTQYTDIYRLTSTTGKTFDTLISKIGGQI